MTEGFPMPALMVLGPLRLRGEAGEAALGGIKPRRLLAVLALNAGEIVSADRLIDVVWNDLPPHSARQNLQTYVWFLRRLLAAAGRDRIRIEAQPPGYLLRAARGELDLHVFRSLSSAGAACLASDPARATKLLGEATALWRGPALDNLADGLPSLRPRIAALEEARLTALDQRIQADLALGRHREIVGELAELAGLYPLFEQFRAHQMVALYRCGRQAEALAVFGDLRRELAEELGIDPGPGLRRLHRDILAADPGLEWPDQGLYRACSGPAETDRFRAGPGRVAKTRERSDMLFFFRGRYGAAIRAAAGVVLLVVGLVIRSGAILVAIGAVLIVWGGIGAFSALRARRQNTGRQNTGSQNTGSQNTGSRNTGSRNTGGDSGPAQ
jgi:DNA-binding SARP family transcriptional activator